MSAEDWAEVTPVASVGGAADSRRSSVARVTGDLVSLLRTLLQGDMRIAARRITN